MWSVHVLPMSAWFSFGCSCLPHHQKVCIHHLSRVGLQWPKAKQGIPNIPLLRNTHQILLVDPKVFPDQMRYVTPPASSASTLRSLPSKKCPEKHPNWESQTGHRVCKGVFYSQCPHTADLLATCMQMKLQFIFIYNF